MTESVKEMFPYLILNMDFDMAQDLASEQGIILRMSMMMKNGNSLVVNDDIQMNRLNVSVNGNTIIETMNWG